jgi:hypothetical protein
MSDPYSPLWDQLNAAANQAAHGKGKERHGNGKPWLDQTMFMVIGIAGIGFALGQALKKTIEGCGMLARDQHDAARQEFLGAIVYLAGACHVLGDVRRGPDDKA